MFNIINHLLTLVRNDDSSFLVRKVHSQVLGLGLLMTGLYLSTTSQFGQSIDCNTEPNVLSGMSNVCLVSNLYNAIERNSSDPHSGSTHDFVKNPIQAIQKK